MSEGSSRSVERHWRRARAYLQEHQLAAAQAQWDALTAEAPGDVRTQILAARIAWRRDEVRDASASALAASANVPDDDPELLCAVLEALLETGESAAANAWLKRPVWRQVRHRETMLGYIDALQELGLHDESLLVPGRIATGEIADAPLLCYKGEELAAFGRLDKAEIEFLECLRLAPSYGRAAHRLVRLRRQTEEKNYLNFIEVGLQQSARDPRMHAAFEFALYHTLEDLGHYDDAWAALARGNAEMHALWERHTAEQQAGLACFVEQLSANVMAAPQREPNGHCPIFIVGMPRSGTTLLERLLSNHSKVATGGELVDFARQLMWVANTRFIQGDQFLRRLPDLDWAAVGQRYLAQTAWRTNGRPYLIDKQPSNWMFVGMIHAALPRAKILNVVRNSMDVCFSNWRALFGDVCSWSYDYANLATQYACYRNLMRYWHSANPGAVLDIAYEALVREPAATLRKVFAFCELPWEPGCEDLQRNDLPVSTLSSAQVREPVHSRALEQWRQYAAQLQPLQRMLQMNGEGNA